MKKLRDRINSHTPEQKVHLDRILSELMIQEEIAKAVEFENTKGEFEDALFWWTQARIDGDEEAEVSWMGRLDALWDSLDEKQQTHLTELIKQSWEDDE